VDEDFGGLLRARQEELVGQLAGLRRDVANVIAAARDTNLDDEHDPEGATIAFERSQLSLLADNAAGELAEVQQALQRLAESSYGRCERCRSAIGVERLAARPASRLCIACAGRPRPQ
jgi:DnaK suppressor protein